jgi:hypothetical protein
MSVIKQMIESLDAISEQMWSDGLIDSAFNALREKASMLSTQIKVHQVLQRGRLSLTPQNPSGLSGALSRVGMVIDAVSKIPNAENYRKFDKFEARQ